MRLAPLLSGCKVCCTGIDEDLREVLKQRIEELGGLYSVHLTRDCTHLIVSSCSDGRTVVQSPKYKFALQLGLTAVRVGWIEEAWSLAHGNGRLEEQKQYVSTVLRRKHAMEGLMGCFVSVTGVPFDERASMASAITALHGTYSPDLTPHCTHLISNPIPDASAIPIKVQYAQKWDIPIVGVSWLWACRDSGRLVDEQEHRIAAEMQSEMDQIPIKLEDIPEGGCVPFLAGCHIALGEPLTPARFSVLKRLILASGGARYSAGSQGDIPSHLTHWIVSQQQLLASQQALALPAGAFMIHEQWLFDCFEAQERLPETPYLVCDSMLKSQPEVKVSEKKSKPFSKVSKNGSSQQSLNSPLITQSQQSFYSKQTNYPVKAPPALDSLCVFFSKDVSVMRRKKLQVKAQHINIRICTNITDADLAITPVLVKERIAGNVDAYTDWWFEASLEANELLPDSEPFSRPVVFTLSSTKNKNLIVSQSGFTGIQREYNAELVRLAGATYTDSLSRSNTHLLLAAKHGSKYDFACKWGIRCVTLSELKNLLMAAPDEKDKYSRDTGGSLTNGFSLTFSQPVQATLSEAAEPHSQTDCGQIVVPLSALLNGKIFTMSQRLWHRRDELSSLVESMGGIFLWNFDRGATHYLHQGNRDQEPFREFVQAQSAGQRIISPLWLLACKEKRQLVAEQDYPHTIKAPEEKENNQVRSHVLDIPADSAKFTVEKPKANAAIDWESIMAEKHAREQQLRPLTKVDLGALMKNSTGSRSESILSSSVPLSVVLTGYSNVEKEAIQSKLSGSIQFANDPITWDRNQTVLFCKQPALSEKFMCACASGSWIVGDVFGLLNWKPECWNSSILERFEVAPTGPDTITPADRLLVAAPRKWRKSSQRAFEDWTVLLWSRSDGANNSKALGQYERILKAGGAEVTYQQCPSLTHVLHLDDEAPPSVNLNIPIYPLRWLIDVLFK